MKATVKKLGNSVAVEVREEKGWIVIEPVTYLLKDLLKGITTKNRREAVDFGPTEGKELW